jgi:NAD(P)H-dependent flavin oxidoreductase YrpB (nitropropane dioxygenase family)
MSVLRDREEVTLNALCERFGFEIPILNAGMGLGIAGPALASAVSEAGGCGVLGLGAMPATLARSSIRAMRDRTHKAFGANFILPLLEDAAIDVAFDEGIPFLVLHWGDPEPFVRDAHRRGIAVFSQVGDADEAAQVAAVGVDGVFIQGREAGGHVKAVRLLRDTLSETVRAVGELPVVASGGMSSGADIAQALRSGASAVSLGTCYVATPEAAVQPAYKERLLAAKARDTVLTQLFDVGWPDANHRVLRNQAYDDWEAAGEPSSGARPGEGSVIGEVEIEGERVPLPRFTVFPPVEGFEGDLEETALYAGESCEAVDRVIPAGELTKQLARELRAAL